MRRTILLFVAMLASARVFSDPRETYMELLEQGKFTELERHITSWARTDDKNPEVYIAWFNYFINKNMKTGMAIDSTIDTRKPHMVITDPKTGKIVGYLGDRVYYDMADVQSAVRYLDQGIGLAANRLDMHFGKIRMLGETGQFDKQSEAIIQALELSVSNGNSWLWSKNAPLPEGKRFLLDNLQEYYDFWLQRSTPDSLAAMQRTAARQIELYPDHSFAYNVLAYYHSSNGKPEEAMRLLLTAYSYNKEDYVIIGNIAMVYRDVGDAENARRYFSIMLESGDPEMVNWATGMINSLR